MEDLFVAPEGVKIFAHEFCGVWPVEPKGSETLAYADGKGIVGKNIEVILEYSDENRLNAERFAGKLRDMGWTNVTLQQEPPKTRVVNV